MNYQYTVIFEHDEEDGGWVAHVPVLHCHSQGDTREEAEENIKETIMCCLEGFQEIGEMPPQENDFLLALN